MVRRERRGVADDELDARSLTNPVAVIARRGFHNISLVNFRGGL